MGFTVNMEGVAEKVHQISANKRLGQFLASEAQRGMDQYVPYRTGQLASSVSASPFTVHYAAPYAKYPFYGRGMTINQNGGHPNATSRWDRAFAEAHGEELGDAGTAFVRTL